MGYTIPKTRIEVYIDAEINNFLIDIAQRFHKKNASQVVNHIIRQYREIFITAVKKQETTFMNDLKKAEVVK